MIMQIHLKFLKLCSVVEIDHGRKINFRPCTNQLPVRAQIRVIFLVKTQHQCRKGFFWEKKNHSNYRYGSYDVKKGLKPSQ